MRGPGDLDQALTRRLTQCFFLRWHMTAILVCVLLSGMVASALLLRLGLRSMPWRYMLAVAGSYLVFFVLIRLWPLYVSIAGGGRSFGLGPNFRDLGDLGSGFPSWSGSGGSDSGPEAAASEVGAPAPVSMRLLVAEGRAGFRAEAPAARVAAGSISISTTAGWFSLPSPCLCWPSAPPGAPSTRRPIFWAKPRSRSPSPRHCIGPSSAWWALDGREACSGQRGFPSLSSWPWPESSEG